MSRTSLRRTPEAIDTQPMMMIAASEKFGPEIKHKHCASRAY